MSCTMREVAKRARVSVATVSRALRGSPEIPAATRQRVVKAAQQLGYHVHPYVSALMQSRRQRSALKRPPPLAFVTAFPTADAWQKQPTPSLPLMFQGAQERAAKRGYPLSHFWLFQDGMTSRRFSEMLRARGVRGVLLPPLPRYDLPVDLVWEYFSAVAIGSGLHNPILDCASNDYYQSMRLALAACRRAGYRRPGLAVDQAVNERIDRRWESAFRTSCEQYGFDEGSPLLRFPLWDAKLIASWIRREKPDLVISVFTQARLKELEALGIRAPKEIGVLSLSVHEPDSPLSGIRQHASLMGAMATDHLIALIERNEHGVPEHPLTLSVKGTWNVGGTMRPAQA